MSLKEFKRAVGKDQKKLASTFEEEVKAVLAPKNARADSLDHPLSVEIVRGPKGVSESRIEAVKAQREAEGWKVTVDPKSANPRYIEFTDPKMASKKKRGKK